MAGLVNFIASSFPLRKGLNVFVRAIRYRMDLQTIWYWNTNCLMFISRGYPYMVCDGWQGNEVQSPLKVGLYLHNLGKTNK